MAASFIVLALCVASTVATGVPVAKYPAGVDPHLCPNYPYCDNVALAVGYHGMVSPYAAPAYATYGHHDTAIQGADNKYPARVDPHHCPNYPYCGPTTVHGVLSFTVGHGLSGVSQGPVGRGWAGAQAVPVWKHGLYAEHHVAGARYPAGVDPQACPNYPYCHH